MEWAFGGRPRKRKPLRKGRGCEWAQQSGARPMAGPDPKGLGELSSEVEALPGGPGGRERTRSVMPTWVSGGA